MKSTSRVELFPDLSLEVPAGQGESLYSLFETRYGVRMIRADERLRAVSADRVSAELAAGGRREARFCWSNASLFTYGHKPVEWRRGFYSTRNYHYHNELG
jgi:GntR family transcriptional regulator